MIWSIIICAVFASAFIVILLDYEAFKERLVYPDKIIHIVYETSAALKKARRLAENVLQYVDDKDLTLEAQQVITEIDKAEETK